MLGAAEKVQEVGAAATSAAATSAAAAAAAAAGDSWPLAAVSAREATACSAHAHAASAAGPRSVPAQLLRGLGVKCDTDTTTELTPGQKFRHWCAGRHLRCWLRAGWHGLCVCSARWSLPEA